MMERRKEQEAVRLLHSLCRHQRESGYSYGNCWARTGKTCNRFNNCYARPGVGGGSVVGRKLSSSRSFQSTKWINGVGQTSQCTTPPTVSFFSAVQYFMPAPQAVWQTPSTGLRHPSSNHCHNWLRHRSRKTVS